MGARTVIGVFASLAVAAAHAQETPLPEGASPEGPSLEDLNAAPPAELSELERLSRTEDDPFAGVLEREEREPVSVTLRALDKITARYTDIEIEMNAIARFGSLEIQPRTCDKRPPEEFPETTAFLEIFDTESDRAVSNLKAEAGVADVDDAEPVAASAEEPALREIEPSRPDLLESPLAALAQTPAPEVLEGPQAEGENIFRGWMFASSPALNALEHPVYDVWVIDCKTRVASN